MKFLKNYSPKHIELAEIYPSVKNNLLLGYFNEMEKTHIVWVDVQIVKSEYSFVGSATFGACATKIVTEKEVEEIMEKIRRYVASVNQS